MVFFVNKRIHILDKGGISLNQIEELLGEANAKNLKLEVFVDMKFYPDGIGKWVGYFR